MTKIRANSYNTGIASEYLIMSKLHRLDLEAYISHGNKKSIDIRVIRQNGSSVSIDVKSVRGYSSIVVNNVSFKHNHIIVIVVYNNKFENLDHEPEIFIIPSLEISDITENYGLEKRLLKGRLMFYKNAWKHIERDGNVA